MKRTRSRLTEVPDSAGPSSCRCMSDGRGMYCQCLIKTSSIMFLDTITSSSSGPITYSSLR
eukprot:1418644-Amphidinium_carterae.1